MRHVLAGGSATAERGTEQRMIGHCEMRLRAARALALEVNEEACGIVAGGGSLPTERQCAIRSAATYATEVAVDMVNDAFRLAGTSSIYAGNVRQRCLRDVTVAAQHYLVADTAYTPLGRARLGLEDVNPMG